MAFQSGLRQAGDNVPGWVRVRAKQEWQSLAGAAVSSLFISKRGHGIHPDSPQRWNQSGRQQQKRNCQKRGGIGGGDLEQHPGYQPHQRQRQHQSKDRMLIDALVSRVSMICFPVGLMVSRAELAETQILLIGIDWIQY